MGMLEGPPKPAALARILKPWFDKQKRTAWKPKVRAGSGQLTDSKFGGHPWLSPRDSWPLCKGCDRPLELFVQLNLEEVPEAVAGRFGKGLLQLFYCRHNCSDGGYEYFNEWMSHVRVVAPSGSGQELPARREKGAFPPKRIVGWREVQDWPKSSEHEQLGLVQKFDFDANTFDVRCDQFGIELKGLPLESHYEYDEQVFSKGIPLGDKLGGWPCWIQSPDYPRCPQCSSIMQFVWQLDSEDHVPFMFGDSGCGYLFQCKRHKRVVAFGWDCH